MRYCIILFLIILVCLNITPIQAEIPVERIVNVGGSGLAFEGNYAAINQDGIIDALDLFLWKRGWFNPASEAIEFRNGDLDDSGAVNQEDALIFENTFKNRREYSGSN